VPAKVVAHGAGVSVFWDDGYHFALPDPLARGTAAGAASGVVTAPMPGLVKAVFAAAGEAVTAGQRLAILEAMKMEHTLTAARDGTVAEVLVAEGQQVEAGTALVRLEEEGDA
jgi:3-methylcrotonyl-CoA carboxylase alpha subunit